MTIAYSLAWPERMAAPTERLDLARLTPLDALNLLASWQHRLAGTERPTPTAARADG